MNNYSLFTRFADSLIEEQESLLAELAQIRRIDYKTSQDFIQAIFEKDPVSCFQCGDEVRESEAYCDECYKRLEEKVEDLHLEIDDLKNTINDIEADIINT